MIYVLLIVLFALVFGAFQGGVYLIQGTTPAKEAKKKLEKIKTSKGFTRFVYEKQIQLRKMGAGVLLKDQMTVSQWYLYKGAMAGLFGVIAFFVSAGIFKSDLAKPIAIFAAVIGWLFLDLFLMSRSVLYGKRGGQFIADALKDAVIVVENKRLKTALMKLRNDLDSGMGLNECLDELELSFSNGEISSFCTVIKSLQSTGQVDEALKTLESNIEREQISVNKKRCLMLEHKTMMYVIFIAMDLMAMILYCIIMKLLEMQIGF